ncbi:ABC bile acid transporter-like protein [Rhizodiscina lignyota]|uniref:ABC bile acid transporter-like protein n=1 Tax=Rhizodiscina lignyota TaxID=1504668 RepID=A0A9P4I853_9PEZI|nr:ABC bile acid transporter-like protein [Rhizodiscina lignyota]
MKPFVEEEPVKSADDGVSETKRPRYLWALLLFCISITGLVFQILEIFFPDRRESAAITSFAWIVCILLIALNRYRTAPIAILVLQVVIFVSQCIVSAHKYPVPSFKDWPSNLVLLVSLVEIVVILLMPLRDPKLSTDGISPPFSTPTSELRSPEEKLTPWQYMTVSWMAPLISIGSKRQVQEQDVWNLAYEFQHRLLHETFSALKGSVLKRLLVANGLDLAITTTLSILELCADLAIPVFLQKLLRSMEDANSPRSAAVTYAVISLAIRLVGAQSGVFNLWYCRRAYERSRGEMIMMLYEKTLRRQVTSGGEQPPKAEEDIDAPLESVEEEDTSIWAKIRRCLGACVCCSSPRKAKREQQKQSSGIGKILNLLRGDAYEVAQRFWEFPTIITKPLGVILSVVLIWKLIGWPCLIGVLTVFFAQGINVFLARALIRQETKRRSATDVKLQKTSQFVEAIRHLRWYGWQDAWFSDIMDSREKELHLRIITNILNITINFVNTISSNLFPVVAFFAYTKLAGLPLRIDIAFPAIDLFKMLDENLRDIPNLITVLINASVAMQRIEDFMNEPDKESTEASPTPAADLSLKDATFAWPGGAEVLHDITLTLTPGLTVVYGEVAAGKTALLQALLGELEKKDGEYVRPDEMFGYCAQNPWLQSMSIRENILFSAPYEETRYKQVLEACALLSDMVEFKNGDLSFIGENGVGLSGGQKARVALARAVYSRARFLLLDDPLSALDHQTAEFIMKRCIGSSLMEGRTIVLITHRTDICHGLAQQWVKISDGRATLVEPSANYEESTLKRTKSVESTTEEDTKRLEEDKLAAVPDKFIEDEHRAHGGVMASVYWAYIKAGKLKFWIILVCIIIVFRLTDTLEVYFIKQWGEAYDKVHTSDLFDDLPPPSSNIDPWLWWFLGIAVTVSIVDISVSMFMVLINYTAGKGMFKQAMQRVSHATFRFYDITPVGRLMNRVTSDMNTIDGSINRYFRIMVHLVIAWTTSVIIIASITPVFLAFAIVLTASFVAIFFRYLPTSQSLRRLEMVSLTPLMSNFGALVEGLTTVRAFCVQDRFQARVIEVVNAFQKMDHFYWSLQAWLMYRFDAFSAFSTLLITLLALWTNVSPGLTAFALIAAEKYVRTTHAMCRFYGQLQMDFVSVERVVELLQLDQEPDGDVKPPAWWPSLRGGIVFENVTLRYAPHLDPSLSDISLNIPAGSNTAIIGRTGSGKSTLALSLLATLVPESGRILIDQEDISTVDRQVLRRRVTFLAQEPMLFPGSMRKNLDPLNEFTDDECEAVLDKIAARHGWRLDTMIDAGGKGLSQGQKQLVGLARAMLRRSAVVILDEATASIDYQTAMDIQRILRDEMKESTVITIAHRLEAVRNADYCIVLSKGKLEAAGPAKEMLKGNENGFGGLLG